MSGRITLNSSLWITNFCRNTRILLRHTSENKNNTDNVEMVVMSFSPSPSCYFLGSGCSSDKRSSSASSTPHRYPGHQGSITDNSYNLLSAICSSRSPASSPFHPRELPDLWCAVVIQQGKDRRASHRSSLRHSKRTDTRRSTHRHGSPEFTNTIGKRGIPNPSTLCCLCHTTQDIIVSTLT